MGLKAKVIATGEIVDIAEYSTIYAENYDTCFYPSELEFLENSEDYWTRLEHQYAGMAMQSLILMGTAKDDAVENTYYYAHALVEKYKKEKK